MNDLIIEARSAVRAAAAVPAADRAETLRKLSDSLIASADEILAANAQDLARMNPASPLYDRLKLTPERLSGIASDIRNVASLPCPPGMIIEKRTLPNGLELKKVRVPFGVVGVIYEARPNVTFDVFSLCFKTGNVCLLKGGSDADFSNRAAVALIRRVLRDNGYDEHFINLLPPTHEAAGELLDAVGYVDLVIPRGGRRLIDFVRSNAKVPCIETGAGVVNTYFDASADLEMGRRIVENGKTRRVSVCNALDCLLVHSLRLSDLPSLCEPLAAKNVLIYADERAYHALDGTYPSLQHATPESYGTEFMDYKMALRTVDSVDEALDHIARYGSGHSEAIITSDEKAAEAFRNGVDAACVYVNAPTSFTDGAQFGLGAEIGISTQKLGPRGPMGPEEMTTYKWLITGNGQTRP